MKKNTGAALVEVLMVLGLLFAAIYYQKGMIIHSKKMLSEIQGERISYDGEKQ